MFSGPSALSFFGDCRVLARKIREIHVVSSADVFQNARTTFVIGCTRPWQLIECCFFKWKKKTDKLLTAVAGTRVWREYNTCVHFRPRPRTYATSFEYVQVGLDGLNAAAATGEIHVRVRVQTTYGERFWFSTCTRRRPLPLIAVFCTRFQNYIRVGRGGGATITRRVPKQDEYFRTRFG